MTAQLLIYESAVPINAQRHGKWSVKTGERYDFARQVNSVPLTAVEFASAAPEYAIVFSGTADVVTPAVILGLRENENMYVSNSGHWNARYIPAFIRRYPFVFAGDKEGKTFTLCIDESYQGCNQQGRGERLFDTEGAQTQYLQRVLSFHKEYQGQSQITRAFCNKLHQLDLLEPMQAMLTLGSGERASLSGFMGISRDRLKALSADQLAELAKADELELAYLHLQSIRNFPAMVERVADDVSSDETLGSHADATYSASETAPAQAIS